MGGIGKMTYSSTLALQLAEPYAPLKEVTNGKLGFKEAIQALLDGKIIVIKQYEVSKKKDVFVKLDQRLYPTTQMTYTMSDSTIVPTNWLPYAIPVNAFSLYSCYIYNKDWYDKTQLLTNGSIVNYLSPSGVEDVAMVNGVYTDGVYVYYQLSREDGYFRIIDLSANLGLAGIGKDQVGMAKVGTRIADYLKDNPQTLRLI